MITTIKLGQAETAKWAFRATPKGNMLKLIIGENVFTLPGLYFEKDVSLENVLSAKLVKVNQHDEEIIDKPKLVVDVAVKE